MSVPYHAANEAHLMILTVSYDAGRRQEVALRDALDLAGLDDAKVKLSHHPDGFVQFSGHGVMSGKEADGRLKGIAVQSAPLDEIGAGPAFGICIADPVSFLPPILPGQVTSCWMSMH